MSHEFGNVSQVERLSEAVQTMAASLAPEITLYGGLAPHTLEVSPSTFSEMLDTRLQVEWAVTHNARQKNTSLESWSFSEGLYRAWRDGWDYEIPISEHPLASLEGKIAKNIDRLLEKPADHKPVVSLDFGGGMGLSWLRIAAQPKYGAAIEKGQLVMAVTNLGATPDSLPDDDGYSGIARSMNNINKDRQGEELSVFFENEEIHWAQENQDRVQYLDANALELGDKSLRLPDGTALPLLDNVDVIHENYALKHTHVPDLALASFDELLSDQGTLYSGAAITYHLMHGAQFEEITPENGETIPMTDEYLYQRRLALAIGSRLLQQSYSYNLTDSRGVFCRPSND